MPNSKMHINEADINTALVKRLLAAQFPKWAGFPVEAVKSAGTAHALYKLGNDMVVRLPRIESSAKEVDREQHWLPKLAPHLPLAIPVPLGKGSPGENYPWHWSVYRWLAGEDIDAKPLTDLKQTAFDLAQFITALQGIDATGGPAPKNPTYGRGVPLARRDEPVRKAIKDCGTMIDAKATTAAWDKAFQASEWNKPSVWVHGDLLPGNLLAESGKLSAVIDWGCLGIGDPACDLIPAWTIFSGESRRIFRETLSADDDMWERGRGWALSIGLIALPYYVKTNPAFAGLAKHMIEEVLNG